VNTLNSSKFVMEYDCNLNAKTAMNGQKPGFSGNQPSVMENQLNHPLRFCSIFGDRNTKL